MRRARQVAEQYGLPVSRPDDGGSTAGATGAQSRSAAPQASGHDPAEQGKILKLERYNLGDFAGGVLINTVQLQTWTSSPSVEDEDDGDDSDEDSSTELTGEAGGSDAIVKSGLVPTLPFHPAFMDAAVLTLSTAKWPLLLDPDGVALRSVRVKCYMDSFVLELLQYC